MKVAIDFTHELIRLVGERAAFALIEQLGGRRVLVPRSPKPGSRWESLLPQALQARFFAELGGTELHIPKGRTMRQIQMQRQIHRWTQQGRTLAWMSQRLGVTRRRVAQIRQQILLQGNTL